MKLKYNIFSTTLGNTANSSRVALRKPEKLMVNIKQNGNARVALEESRENNNITEASGMEILCGPKIIEVRCEHLKKSMAKSNKEKKIHLWSVMQPQGTKSMGRQQK